MDRGLDLNEFTKDEKRPCTPEQQDLVAEKTLKSFRGASLDKVEVLRDNDGKLIGISVYSSGKSYFAKIDHENTKIILSEHGTETGGLVDIKEEDKINDVPEGFEVNNDINIMEIISVGASAQLSIDEKVLLESCIKNSVFNPSRY